MSYSAVLITTAAAMPPTRQPLSLLSPFPAARVLADSPLQGFFHSRECLSKTGRDPTFAASALSPFIQLYHILPTVRMLQPHLLPGYAKQLSPCPSQSSCKEQHQRGNSQIAANASSSLLLPIARSISSFPIEIFCILLPRSLAQRYRSARTEREDSRGSP